MKCGLDGKLRRRFKNSILIAIARKGRSLISQIAVLAANGRLLYQPAPPVTNLRAICSIPGAQMMQFPP